MSATDDARVTGFVGPAENDRWRIDVVEAPASGLIEGLGTAMRTGRGFAEPNLQITRLVRKPGRLVMSDTPDELRDLSPILRRGRGRVLVNGLGLGCVVKGLLAKPEVEHVDVVEVCPELIELVGRYYEGERCTIHEGDAFSFEWARGLRWDAVWHDVWDELCADNLNERSGAARPGSYERLHRRYGRRAEWQGSWGWDFLRYQAGRGY